MSSLETQEEMITSNADSMSQLYRAELNPLIGKYNNTTGVQDIVRLRIIGVMSTLEQNLFDNLGPQLIDGSIISLAPSALMADKLVVQLAQTLPAPLNYIVVFLNILVGATVATVATSNTTTATG